MNAANTILTLQAQCKDQQKLIDDLEDENDRLNDELTGAIDAADMLSDEVIRSSASQTASSEILGICDRALQNIKPTIPTIIQRDVAIHERDAARSELALLRSILKDPEAVWANMLRGEIARPSALDHYEECKARVEELESAQVRVAS